MCLLFFPFGAQQAETRTPSPLVPPPGPDNPREQDDDDDEYEDQDDDDKDYYEEAEVSKQLPQSLKQVMKTQAKRALNCELWMLFQVL